MYRHVWLPVALVAAGAIGCKPEDTDTGSAPVEEGPTLEHTAPAQLVEGQPAEFTVGASDEDGVDQVALYYRTEGEGVWGTLVLEDRGDGTFAGTVDGIEIDPPAFEYYFRAQDGSALHAASYLPEAGEDGPLSLPVQVEGLSLPYVEDFEDADSTGSVWTQGWGAYSLGFAGYGFTITSARSSSGEWSAGHTRGAEGLEAFDDWLVSPALDLTAYPRVQVTWYEDGDYVEYADHSLWISTGSADPADGDYAEISALAAPTGAGFSRSAVIDLTAYAGAPVAYLAWRYEGQYADAWYIDDVEVRELGPDLEITEVTTDRVEPGGTTAVTLTVANLTEVAAADVVFTFAADAGDGLFTDSPVTVATIDGLGTAEVAATLQVDAAHPDNAWLPITIEATDGTQTWTWSERVIVGEPSSATVTITSDAGGLVDVSVGVGDPDAPDVEVGVAAVSAPAGSSTWTVDLTDWYAFLPPAAGDLRWWLRVESVSSGTVDDFRIAWDGQEYVSDDTGAFSADTEALFWLPRPPAPVITASSTVPTTVAPGDVVTWTVRLTNEGAETTGDTSVTLTSSDPDVTVLTTTPIQLDATGWDEGATALLPLQFQVSSAHTDSAPVELELVVTDAVESFTVEAEVEVPWPVLRVTRIEIDDDTYGNGDGLLDASERARLTIYLTNNGDLATFASVSCTMSQTGGSASVSFADATATYGVLSVGETADENDFDLTVTGGSAGDTLAMQLSCTDGTATYTPTFDLVLGEPPWLVLSPTDDDPADAVGGYAFDLVNGKYRSDGTTLTIVFESSVEYDISTAFIEAWGFSTGADYQYYQLVIQSGAASMRGYDGSFTSLSKPTVTAVDSTHLQVDVDLASMGLSVDEITAGFAAGFCGDETYYCDHLPDDWGDPYQTGFYTSRWVSLEW